MRIHLCGVRGSTPAPGAEFVRYGGHTSCVAVAHGDGPPTLLLDAGTGIRRVGELTDHAPFAGTILLGHLHWDHTEGLPFFRAGDDPEARVDVYVPAPVPGSSATDLGGHPDPATRLSGWMSPPYFPITPWQLRGRWAFHDLDEGTRDLEGFAVLAREIPHKGGRTFGFRIETVAGSFAYLSDHHPVSFGAGPDGFGPYHEAALTLTAGVDVLLHDAQYTAAEFAARASFGHSAVEYAVGLGQAAGVGEVVLFHHDPTRTDDELDALVAALPPLDVPVRAAAEGTVISLGADQLLI